MVIVFKRVGFVNRSLLCRVIACVVSVVLAVSFLDVAYADASDNVSDTTTTTTSVEDTSSEQESVSDESSDTEDTSDTGESSNTGDTADADDTVDVGDSSEAVTEQTDELSGSGLQSDSDTTDSDESLSASTLSSETSLLSSTTSNVAYINASGQKVTRQNATIVTSSSTIWTSTDTDGWYVVTEDVTINDRITCSGAINLILADGAKLTASQGITVNSGEGTLTIYGQTKGTGTLEAKAAASDDNDAGIGGTSGKSNGAITINGGTVTATGNKYAAGIGGGYYGNGSDVTINGGTVTATAGMWGAGIGGGYGYSGSAITISGGTVTAYGSEGAAGIGGGSSISVTDRGDGYNITISGGDVYAEGGTEAAAIGGGSSGNGSNIKITGGTVTAVGGEYGTGIGAGVGGSAENIVIGNGSVKAQSLDFDFLTVSGNDAVSVTPTDGNGNDVYCLEISGMAGIDEVMVGNKTYTRSGDHQDDGTFYPWVSGETHIVMADGDTYIADWDDDSKSFTLIPVTTVDVEVGDDVFIDADDDLEDTEDEDAASGSAGGGSSEGTEEGDEGSTSDVTDTYDVVADASSGVLAQTGASVGVLCVLMMVVVCGAVAALVLRKHGKEQHV